MRPHLNLRARGAMTALGALCLAISLSVLPGTAQSSDTNGAHAAVADLFRHAREAQLANVGVLAHN